MAVKLQPLGNLVVIKAGSKEEVSTGGVLIPDTAQEKTQEGEVIAVGPGRRDKDGKRELLDVKVGDWVIYPRFGGVEYKVMGEDLLIFPESQLLAKKTTK